MDGIFCVLKVEQEKCVADSEWQKQEETLITTALWLSQLHRFSAVANRRAW